MYNLQMQKIFQKDLFSDMANGTIYNIYLHWREAIQNGNHRKKPEEIQAYHAADVL